MSVRFRHVLFTLLMLVFAVPASAQWRTVLKNDLSNSYNVIWILQYEGEVSSSREIEGEIRVRRPGTFQDVLQKPVKLPLGQKKWFHIPLRLPSAIYEVEVEVYDQLLNESTLLAQREEFLVNESSGIQVSDIFFSAYSSSDSAFQFPIISENIPVGLDTIFYFMKIRADRNLTVRSSEFFYESAGQASAAKGEISLFASLQEQTRDVYLPASEQQVISGFIPISDYEEGAYLLEISVDYGQGEPIQETVGFYIGSNLKQKIYANLDDAIRQMIYIVPEPTLEELLDSPTKEARIIEFQEAWEDLYQERSKEKMEQYYARIYEAQNRFSTASTDGWQSDRGKTFMLYGEPGQREPLERGGAAFEQWIYPRWSLMFLFEKRNQDYFLVE